MTQFEFYSGNKIMTITIPKIPKDIQQQIRARN